jgi:excisionase family DNA binding protein
MSELIETPLMTIAQAIKYLKLSSATLSRMRRDNKGPTFVRMGTRVLYRKTDLDAFIEASAN